MAASTDALARVTAAVFTHADRLRAMDETAFIERCIEIGEPFAVDPADTLKILMARAVEAGSLEAVAAMAVMGVPDEETATAMRALVERYPDVKEGAAMEGLKIVVEEWLEEEVAAGRMTVTLGPNGEKLYSSVETGTRK